MVRYEPIIGLEVHIELSTASKMFCACNADYFSANPNTHVCPVCLGLPGAMPHANKKAIELAQLFGLALGCKLNNFSKFDRKNYFYPDLAKGFQISQYDLPFSQNGKVEIKTGDKTKKIGITRAHLEEDTGKLTHTQVDGRNVTLIDFNRSGVPLLEIVTEPDMRSAQEAKAYAQSLQQIARYIGASDADMEKGSMRIEPNVSLRPISRHSEPFNVIASETKQSQGKLREESHSKKQKKDSSSKFTLNAVNMTQNDTWLPEYKVELKNINSFRFAEKAIEYEIKRQGQILDSGKIPAQETRGWNENRQATVSQRSKEFAHDYRYFPEPDLPPLEFDQKYLNRLISQLPELPDKKLERFRKEFALGSYDAEILTRSRELADFFEEAAKAGKKHGIGSKRLANELINKKTDIEKILPAEFVLQIYKTSQAAQIPDDELDKIIRDVLSQNIKAAEDYKKGKKTSVEFLIGQVQKMTKGATNPQKVKELLLNKLK
ncbi:hypothetical protein A3A60_02480 [Candidatus Curtissbacteria bacterium RIFCSPLOWO2_01_FULL_42_26]|uniref:Aspartyl/glutamyl-tRNA(Asn/Gln) amidotransferase subunit B n=1 Tax=Candidatus Curtissbacteria bacterium RIFCSPLOWO2_01_FULL_42_26 TaxID=1797729 RepID=A0A1F5I356_9BACT|nr:MAG: hypothetical protein A3A60_02480 [Candidatus Curtissbacteria bacterium RIFCSPLOWO2_01_FULL_42_26]